MTDPTDDDEPPASFTLEERMLILERTLEVLRQELISQNKRIARLEPRGDMRRIDP